MILDHSALHVWRQCKRKFYWTYVQELAQARSDAMERGSFAHRLLYEYYRTKDVQGALASGSYERPPGMMPGEEQKYVELEQFTRELVRGYVKELVPQDHFEVKALELPLAYHIFGSNYYVGVLDQMIEVKSVGELVHEFKTSAQIPEGWVTKFQIDQQSTGYVFLGRKNGFNPKGAMLSLLRATKYPDYVRDTVLTPDWLLEEFEAELHYEMGKIEEALNESEGGYPAVFTKSTDACYAYNQKCPFHKMCCETPYMRQQMLAEGFYPKREPRELKILEKVKEHERIRQSTISVQGGDTGNNSGEAQPDGEATLREAGAGEEAR